MTTIPSTVEADYSSGTALADLLPYVDVDQLIEQIETMHGGAEGAVCLVRRDADQASLTPHTWAPMLPPGSGAPPDDLFREMWRNCLVNGSRRWNMYVALSTFNRPEGMDKEGKPLWYQRQAKYVQQVCGFFADLDVKPGVEGEFGTRAELEAFLAKLPAPSMLVDSGSGGAHAYWLTTQRLPGGRATAKLLNGWHDYLQERAGAVVLDHVMEPARILRLAGTVRWTKPEELAAGWPAFTRVQLRYSDGPRYPVEELAELCRDAFTRCEERRVRVRSEFNADRQQSIDDLARRGLDSGNRAYLEQQFNLRQDWAVLLERGGWTLVADGRDGSGHSRDCRSWRRPGLPETAHYSASTDWGESHLMTLYSNDPAVAGLADPNIPSGRFRHTTKYRFALVALYGGDEAALLLDAHRSGGVLA